MNRCLFFITIITLTSASSPIPTPFPVQLECDVYELAYEYAHHIQKDLTKTQEKALFDALQLQNCNTSTIIPPSTITPPSSTIETAPIYNTPSNAIFVDATKGNDNNPGTKSKPLQTLHAARDLSRTKRTKSDPSSTITIALRTGIYYLTSVLLLGGEDSHLIIQNYNGEKVQISGATPLLNLQWSKHKQKQKQKQKQSNIWSTKIPSKNLRNGTMTGLRYNGKRAIRARWPNGNPETQLFPEGWSNAVTWGLPKTFDTPVATTIVVNTPNRSNEGPCEVTNGFCYYTTGINGACLSYGFDPPSGYWCSKSPPRGQQYSTSFPANLQINSSETFFHSFTPNQTIVNAFRSGHWFSYVFLIDQYNSTTNNMSWTIGGFQGGEGVNTAAEFNIENHFDLLDSENEWFYNKDTEILYWFYNDTANAAPPLDLLLEGTQLQELIRIQGAGTALNEKGAHVVDVLVQGLIFTGTAASYLEPHGLPSDGGGDWALARTAAINVEGTENINIQNCLFERLDGNGLLISGYNRNVSVRNNEFRWIGENPIISWGYTSDFDHANVSRPVPIPKGQGPSATDGNHPQGTQIDGNFFHEIGHYQKQVSCYFQAQTTTTNLTNNICFNGPRAGINFNDGMGGGNLLDSNLIFNMVRETADHGSFNSWDRQPFLYINAKSKKATYVPVYNEIVGNFWINNYNPQEATDNDDGSCYYNTHHNFFPFSVSGLKSDYGGHDNHHHHNLYINGGKSEFVTTNCVSICGQKKGHEDSFFNNTCILINGSNYAKFEENEYGTNILPLMHDNSIYTSSGKATETGSVGQFNISTWQKKGHDLGTTVNTLPSNQEMIEMAKKVLGMDVDDELDNDALDMSNQDDNKQCQPYPLCDPLSTAMTKNPPPIFNATFVTTQGNFNILVNTSWSPHGALRFYNLVRNGFYNQTYFFRVISGFVNEFGLSGNPQLQKHYCNDLSCSTAAMKSGAAIQKDKGPLIGQGNTYGTVAYSLMNTGGNASVEIYINYGDNSRLDKLGFRPFGVVNVDDMTSVVEHLYKGYGELNETDLCPDPNKKLCKGPKIDRMLKEGNVYLQQNFPKMSLVQEAWVGE